MTDKTANHDRQAHSVATYDDDERWTPLMPFIILSCLSLPILAMMAVVKPLFGYGVTSQLGIFTVLRPLLWVGVPLALLCGVGYIVLSRRLVGRLLVGMMMVALTVGFLAGVVTH